MAPNRLNNQLISKEKKLTVSILHWPIHVWPLSYQFPLLLKCISFYLQFSLNFFFASIFLFVCVMVQFNNISKTDCNTLGGLCPSSYNIMSRVCVMCIVSSRWFSVVTSASQTLTMESYPNWGDRTKTSVCVCDQMKK